MRKLKLEAVRRGQTMSELVEEALRMLVEPKEEVADLPPLPEFHSGGLLVSIEDRDRLYNAVDPIA